MKNPTERTKMTACGSRALALLVVLIVMFVATAPAHADGRFVYETCDPQLPAGNPPSFRLENWFGGTYGVIQTCSSPSGGVGIGEGGPQSANWGDFEAVIPSTPGGWVESLTLSASAGAFDANSDEFWIRGGEQIAAPSPWPVPGFGDSSRYFLLRTHPPTASELPRASVTAFGFQLGCPFGHTCQPGPYVVAHYIGAMEVDPTPPIVAGLEGSLVSGDVLRGHQAVQAQATDVGGGVRSLELKINGFTVPGTAIGGCSIVAVENPNYKGLVATSPTPCPPSLSGVWNVDTSAPPFQNGANTVQVCASDFASKGAPNTTCSNPQTVQVNNSCTESPVAGGADITAGFGNNGSDDLTVGFGTATEITGQLTDQSGNPISGATICLQAQPAGSAAAAQTVGSVKTDSQGDFSMEVKPGANRQLLVGYRHDSFQVEKKLSLETRARPTVKLDSHEIRGGKRVEISGKLPKPDAGERVLVLQGSSAHGDDWLTFKKVTTDPEGNYSTTYRFTKPRKKTTYRVRVVAPAQAGYEYEPGASKAARVRVRP